MPRAGSNKLVSPDAGYRSDEFVSGTVLVVHPGAELYGSDRVLLETVDSLVSFGRSVVVAVPRDGPLVVELEHRGATVEICSSPVLRKSALTSAGLVKLMFETTRSIPAIIGLIRRSQPAVVVVNTITIPLWIVLSRVMGSPVICHVHEAEASQSLWVRRALALPLFMANRLIVNSRFSLSLLTESFVRLGAKASVVLNPILGPLLPPIARETLSGSIRLLYVGRLSPRKGPDVAIEAANILRARGVPVKLDFVGSPFAGYEWFEAELRESVQRNGLSGVVTFHGFRSEVRPFFLSADVVLVPSVGDESFGNTAVEATLYARPVVVSGTTGLLEAIEGYGSAQQVCPADPAELVSAVERIRDAWPIFRANALTDSRAAAVRHSPESYARLVNLIVALTERW